MTGAAIVTEVAQQEQESPPSEAQADIIQAFAKDLQYTLSRKGRAPFVMSAVPMFEALCALRDTLACCLDIHEHPTLQHWHSVLHLVLPSYAPAIADIQLALQWVDGIHTLLDVPLSADGSPALGADAVALQLAHYLGTLTLPAPHSAWLLQFLTDLRALSQRYWSGLFHAYDIVGLPRTNNALESLFRDLRHQLRRRLGVSKLSEPLLRHGAWTLFSAESDSPASLADSFALVPLDDYLAERQRYELRQSHFSRRFQWRHQRDLVLQNRVNDWAAAAESF